MARIRSIKPEFWEDDIVGSLTPLARLLFIGTWNAADDEGLLRWTPDYLNATFFMYDALTNKRVQQLMTELTDAGLVFPYSGGKTQQQLAYVVNFRRHQKINRAQPGKFAPPSVQNRGIQQMYARRDAWTCHLCTFPIPPEPLDTCPDLHLSLDHVIPRISGGTDYPSNIRASHTSCNKARRDKPIDQFTVPRTVLDALHRAGIQTVNDSRTDSVNDSVNGSPLTRAGAPADQGAGSREQGREQGAVNARGANTDRDDHLITELLDEHLRQISRPVPPAAVVKIRDAITDVHITGTSSDDIRAGLSELRRRGGKPGLLPHLVADLATNGAAYDDDPLSHPDAVEWLREQEAAR